jgi:hypothetical protein
VSWYTPKCHDALRPIKAHNVGIASKYFGKFSRASIKKPKVMMVVGQGNPRTIVLSKDIEKNSPVIGYKTIPNKIMKIDI